MSRRKQKRPLQVVNSDERSRWVRTHDEQLAVNSLSASADSCSSSSSSSASSLHDLQHPVTLRPSPQFSSLPSESSLPSHSPPRPTRRPSHTKPQGPPWPEAPPPAAPSISLILAELGLLQQRQVRQVQMTEEICRQVLRLGGLDWPPSPQLGFTAPPPSHLPWADGHVSSSSFPSSSSSSSSALPNSSHLFSRSLGLPLQFHDKAPWAPFHKSSSRASHGRSGRPHRACHFCGKVLSSDSSLQIHLRSHTGERPYQCPVCLSRFTTRGNLKVHFLRHREQNPELSLSLLPPPMSGAGSSGPAQRRRKRRTVQDVRRGAMVEGARGRPHPSSQISAANSQSQLSREVAVVVTTNPNCSRSPSSSSVVPSNLSSSSSPSPLSITSLYEGSHPFDENTPPHHTLHFHSAHPQLTNLPKILFPASPSQNRHPGLALFQPTAFSGSHPTDIQQPQLTFPLLPSSPSDTSKLQRLVEKLQKEPQRLSLRGSDEAPASMSNMDTNGQTTITSSSLQGEPKAALARDPSTNGGVSQAVTGPNQCGVCLRVLSSPQALSLHQAAHLSDRPFLCTQCSRSFSTRGNLRAHQATHRAQPLARAQNSCPLCQCKFTNALALRRHVRMHLGGQLPPAASEPQVHFPPPTDCTTDDQPAAASPLPSDGATTGAFQLTRSYPAPCLAPNLSTSCLPDPRASTEIHLDSEDSTATSAHTRLASPATVKLEGIQVKATPSSNPCSTLPGNSVPVLSASALACNPNLTATTTGPDVDLHSRSPHCTTDSGYINPVTTTNLSSPLSTPLQNKEGESKALTACNPHHENLLKAEARMNSLGGGTSLFGNSNLSPDCTFKINLSPEFDTIPSTNQKYNLGLPDLTQRPSSNKNTDSNPCPSETPDDQPVDVGDVVPNHDPDNSLPSAAQARHVLGQAASSREGELLSSSEMDHVSRVKVKTPGGAQPEALDLTPHITTEKLCSSPPNQEKLCSSPPNQEKLCSSPPNQEKLCSSPPNQEKLCSSPPNHEKLCSSPPNQEKLCSSPPNQEKLCSSPPNHEKLCSSPPNQEKLCSSPPNQEKLCSSPPNHEKLCSSPPNQEKLCSFPPNTEKLCSSPPNPEKLCSSPPNHEKLCSSPPNPEKLCSSPPNHDKLCSYQTTTSCAALHPTMRNPTTAQSEGTCTPAPVVSRDT